jgi:deoxyribodipyrimidine photolyase
LILPPEQIEYRKVFTPFYKKWRPIVDSLNIELKKVEKISTDFDIQENIEIPNGKHPYFTLDTARDYLVNFDFKNYEAHKDFP